jgi:PAS domain S-box-containing protein
VLCPAHGERKIDCWLIPSTHCAQQNGEDYFSKLSTCLSCPFFKNKGEQREKGWNYFLSRQLQRYNFQALERIYQKEESFIEILDRIPDGLFTTDKEWRITYFNPAAEKITGFSAYDAVGMYCKDVFKNAICETDCALKRAVADGCDIHNREYEITNIEGKKIPIICSTSVFLDSSGQITGGLEIFKDITDFKRLQQEITRREKKYSRILEGSHDMIYTTTPQGDFLNVNQAGVEMLGYRNKEELLGIGSAAKLYRKSSDRTKFLKIINRDGYVKDYEADFKKRSGEPIHVLISARRYENAETGDIEYEGIIKDITHRKLTENILKQRNRELSILNSVAVALNLTMELDYILEVTLSSILKTLRLKRGALFLIDRDKRQASLHVRYGLPVQDPAYKSEIIFKDDLLQKNLIDQNAPLTPKPTFPPFQVTYRAKGGQKAPWLHCFLITFKGEGVGFFGFDIPPPRELALAELHLLGSLGNFLGGTIENARLMKTIRHHRQDLRGLTDKLFQSQEEERRRIARELHDEAGQALTGVKLGLDRFEENIAAGGGSLKKEIDAIRKLVAPNSPVISGLDKLEASVSSKEDRLKEEMAEIRKMIGRTSNEIRQLSYRLHPTLLSDLGLEPALDLYFKEVAHHSDLDIDFHMVGFDQRLDRDTETVLYRFSQEALTNTLKHSGAELFSLSIIKSYPKIIFRAEDDGIGFDGQISGGTQMSLGLLGMRERASLLGGTFQLSSKPGKGTRIRIEIPLGEAQSHGQTD